MEYVAIVGTGNMGTKTLGRIIGEDKPKVLSLWEPEPKFIEEGFSYPIDYNYIYKQFLDTRPVWAEGYDLFVESNSLLWSLLPVAKLVYPTMKAVHIIRDGKDYLRSVMTIYEKVNKVNVATLPRFRDLLNHHGKDRYISNLEFYSWLWHHMNHTIRRDLKEQDIPHLTLYYDDLFGNTRGARKELNEFLGIIIPDNKYAIKENYNPHYGKLPPFEEWSDEDQQVWYKEKERW